MKQMKDSLQKEENVETLERGELLKYIALLKERLSQCEEEKKSMPGRIRFHYQQLFLQSPAVWLIIDPHTGAIVEANAAAAAFYGYSRQELRDMEIFEINIAEKATLLKMIEKAAQGKFAKPLQFRHKLKSGVIKDVESYTGPYEMEGRLLLSSIIIDITEKCQAEEALQSNLSRLAFVIESANAAIWEWDAVKGKMFYDESWKRMLCYETDEELDVSEGWRSHCHPEDITLIEKAAFAYLSRQTERYEVEYRLRRKDGSYHWFRAIGKAIFGKGQRPIRWVGCAFDITEQMKIRQMLYTSYELRRRSDLLNDLIIGVRSGDRETLGFLKKCGVSFEQPLYCAVIQLCHTVTSLESDAFTDLARWKDEMLERLNHYRACIAWASHEGIGILCQLEQGSYVEASGMFLAQIESYLRQEGAQVEYLIGVGEVGQGPEGFKKSFQQARWAVEASLSRLDGNGRVFYYRDLGILQLFTQSKGTEGGQDFVERTLGSLIRHDTKKGTDYIATLEVLLQAPNLKDAAQQLFLHYNTLAFRKRRIEKILDCAISEFEVKVTLAAALKLYRLMLSNQ